MWRGCAAAKHLSPTGGAVTLCRGEVPMFWWFTGFVLFGYLTGLAGVGGFAYFNHPEFGVSGALVEGAFWPGTLMQMIRAPGL